MDKELAIQEIADILALYFKDPIDADCPYCKAAEALFNLGYRKVRGEPPEDVKCKGCE